LRCPQPGLHGNDTQPAPVALLGLLLNAPGLYAAAAAEGVSGRTNSLLLLVLPSTPRRLLQQAEAQGAAALPLPPAAVAAAAAAAAEGLLQAVQDALVFDWRVDGVAGGLSGRVTPAR
jgi:hypothetical protein